MDIRSDNTLGTETSIPIIQGNNTFIEGGASRGINLFHSFEEFNIDAGEAAYFTVGDIAIENIFSRITGSDPSDILGTLGTCISSDCPNARSTATLYFMNPNGIFFGPGASLDLGGSFVATTANAIEFGESGIYGTAPSEIGSDLLTVNPSAFLFNQSIAQRLNSIESRATLSVPENHSFLLVGGRLDPNETSTGDIVIKEGRLRSPGGQIGIGGLAAFGRVGLSGENNHLSLVFPENVTRSNFRMTGEVDGFAELDVTSGNGGDISIYARHIDILGGSDVCAGIGSAGACGSQSTDFGSADSQGGNIIFNASETVTISDPFSVIINDIYPNAVGNSGDIVIQAESFNLINGGQLSANTSGRGNSGKIIIDATGNVLLQEGDSDVFIFNEVNPSAVGSSGGIEITTGTLEILQGAQILSRVIGRGTSGGIAIRAEEAVLLDGRENNEVSAPPSAISTGVSQGAEGQGGNIDIVADSLSINNRAQVISNTEGAGNAGSISIKVEGNVLLSNSIIITEVTEGTGNGRGGDIQISADSLELREGSALLADAENIGDAGNIIINVRDAVLLQGQGPGATDPDEILPSQISTTVEPNARGRGGEITISANSLSVTDNGFISSRTFGDGDSGNIDVVAERLSLQAGGKITASTFGERDSGDVSLEASNILVDGLDQDSQTRSSITAQVEAGAVGDGGNLSIDTDKLRVTGGGFISARTDGSGNAGSLTVTASEVIDLFGTTPDRSIRSNLNAITTTSGRGGDLRISSPYLNITGGAGIAVSTFGEGDAGSLRIRNAELIQIIGSANAETPSWLDAEAGESSTGQGGSIEVQSNTLRIADSGLITARSFSTGVAGGVTLKIADTLHLSDGGITTQALNSSGGNITINAVDGEPVSISGLLILEGDSDITTESSDAGGNIKIGMAVVAFSDSDILARSENDNGGNIDLGALFSATGSVENPSPFEGNDKVDVNADGALEAGNIAITDTSFIQNDLAELADNLVNTDRLLLGSCVVRGQENEGTIAIAGSGNLLAQPGVSTATTYSTGDVSIVEGNPSEGRLSQPNGAVIEPQAVYALPDGRLVMSRPCF